MARSWWIDLQLAAWVRWRDLWARMGFWLTLLGFDAHTRTIDSKLYLVYAILFFMLWIFMVLTLLASFGGQLLLAWPAASIETAAVSLGVLGGVLVFLLELFTASRRSPFVFSEEDAHLLLQTPLDRRSTALVWFLENWLLLGLAVWVGAIVLGYSLIEARFPGQLTAADLPLYLLAGLRTFSLAVPLYLGGKGLAWAAGAYRLHGLSETRALRLVAPVLVAVLLSLWAAGGIDLVLTALWPLAFAVRAGLALAGFLPGLLVAVLLGILGVFAVWRAAQGMSLSRAYQETRDRQVINAAVQTGQTDLAQELLQRRRLGSGRKPFRLPAWPGLAALPWKAVLQNTRLFSFGGLLGWLSIAGLVVGLLTFPDLSTRAWMGLMGLVLIAQRVASSLRRDLSRWWLLRQLPFRAGRLVLGLLALPVISLWLAGLLGAGAARFLGAPLSGLAVLLYALLVPQVALLAAGDLLRQSKTSRLMQGSAPGITPLGLLLVALCALAQLGLLWFLQGTGPAAAVGLLALGLPLIYAFWQRAGSLFNKVE